MNSGNMKKGFKVNDVVWGKLKGFPWWPAVIVKYVHNKEHVNDNVVLIKFIGDLTTAVISISRLLSFDEHYIRFSTTKHKQLLRAITEAKRIHNGEISFSHYCKSIKHLGNKRTRNTNENVDNEINKLNTSLSNIINASQFKVNDVIHIVKEITQLLHNVREERNKRKIRRIKHKVITMLNMHLFAYDNSDIFNTNDNTSIDVCALKNEICDLIDMYNKHNNATTQQTHVLSSSTIDSSSIVVSKSDSFCNSSSSINGSNCSSNMKTDDDDFKHKIKIRPLSYDNACVILSSLMSNGITVNENEHGLGYLINTIINNIEQNDDINVVKCIYLRKRICRKLYNMFTVMLKGLCSVNDDDIKKLCVALEKKARCSDKEMGVEYKCNIRNIFNIVKNGYLRIEKDLI